MRQRVWLDRLNAVDFFQYSGKDYTVVRAKIAGVGRVYSGAGEGTEQQPVYP